MLTFCLMTCGEETETDCMSAFRRSSAGHDVVFSEVRGVVPASRALNAMIAGCVTEFLVPLDADFLLYDGFMSRIKDNIGKYRHDPTWHSILFPLWDTLTQIKIMALKVFRADVVKLIPYKDDACPDIQHYRDLTAAGYGAIDLMHEDPIGDHVVRGEFLCYAKLRDLYMVARSHPEAILESHFKGGKDLKSRANKHFGFFRERLEQTGSRDYLYCIAGMVEGLIEPLDRGSKDLKKPMKVPAEDAVEMFSKWSARQSRTMI